MSAPIAQALLSVSDKTGLVDFARGLAGLGVALLSTGGTAKALSDAGLAVTEIGDYTGFPEMLDGRVKTLHPKVHAGILARRDVAGARGGARRKRHSADRPRRRQSLPVSETVAKSDCTLEEAIENIDIGGPTLLRAAAKNWAHVGVVVEPARLRPGAWPSSLRTARCFRSRRVSRSRERPFAHRVLRRRRFELAHRARSGRRGRGVSRPLQPAGGQGAGPALRRKPAPAGRLLPRRETGAGDDRHLPAAARQGTVVQQPRGCGRRVGVREVARVCPSTRHA